MASGYARRFVHFGPGPATFKGLIAGRAVKGAWFELHRRGGCGAGQLVLSDGFADRAGIEIGDWIALEYAAGDRWYLGRVERRTSTSPARVTLDLFGMGAQLGEVFPGGFGSGVGDGRKPHRYARSDFFAADPDHSSETADAVSQPGEVVQLLLDQYVVPATDITYTSADVEPVMPGVQLASLKFRGEESARRIVQELAARGNDASWGVNATGSFFFLRKRTAVVATFQEGAGAVGLQELRSRALIFNRILLTGGYVYPESLAGGAVFRGFYRWRGNYVQPQSRDQYGERPIALSIPWIRHGQDGAAFAKKFFAQYAAARNRYVVEAGNQTVLPRPWSGRVKLLDRGGAELGTFVIETVRVQFDHAPVFRMELGPEDPRETLPVVDGLERWGIAGRNAAMGWGGAALSSDSQMFSLIGGSSGTFQDHGTVTGTYGSMASGQS